MLAFASRHSSFGVRAALSSSLVALAFAAVASGGGCTLLVGNQLSDKPSEGAGGAGGQGGDGGASSAVNPSSGAAQSSTSAHGSSSTGGIVCKPGTADCNGELGDGCEAKLLSDPKHCGSCTNICGKALPHCKEGMCTP